MDKLVLSKLDNSIKMLINDGHYSLYSLDDHSKALYLLYIPGATWCCNPNGGEPKNYLLDKDGMVMERIENTDGLIISAVVRNLEEDEQRLVPPIEIKL